MELRMVEVGDLPALSRLYGELTGCPSDMEEMARVFTAIRNDPHYVLLGAYGPDGQLVGTSMGIECYDLVKDCRPFMVIENVVVSETCRGQGIGRVLIRELERIAADRGCALIILVSGAQRTGAHRFYETLGYSMDRARGFKKELGR